MSRNPAADTIIGKPIDETYDTVPLTMPDGTKHDILVQKALDKDGKIIWEMVDPKLRATREMEARFDETDSSFKPADWQEPDTKNTLAPKKSTKTARDLHATLILTIGEPAGILQRKALMPDKAEIMAKNKVALTLVYRLIDMLDDPQWNAVLAYLPRPVYPS